MKYLNFSRNNSVNGTFELLFRPRGTLGLVALLWYSLSPPAQAQEVPDLDPQAVEILTNATEFLANQESMSVDWFVSFDVIVDGREKITYARSGNNILVRGKGFYSYSEFGNDTREYFYDNENFQIHDVGDNAFVTAPFADGFDVLVDRIDAEYEIVLPIWQIMSSAPKAELLDDATDAAYLGTTRLEGRPAYHLAFSDYDRDWQIWISTDPDRPEILSMVGTDPYVQGWPQYRAYFSNWNFEPEVPDGVFTYVPDETAEQMTWPKLSERVEVRRDDLQQQGQSDVDSKADKSDE